MIIHDKDGTIHYRKSRLMLYIEALVFAGPCAMMFCAVGIYSLKRGVPTFVAVVSILSGVTAIIFCLDIVWYGPQSRVSLYHNRVAWRNGFNKGSVLYVSFNSVERAFDDIALKQKGQFDQKLVGNIPETIFAWHCDIRHCVNELKKRVGDQNLQLR